MADDNDKSPLTRRRVLGGMATIGAAGALGAGSWAAFSDQAQVVGNLTAGELDGQISYSTSYLGKSGKSQSGIQAHPGDEDNVVAYTVEDLKPGDYGSIVFEISLAEGSNPAWVFSCIDTENNNENGRNSNEKRDGDSTDGDPGNGAGELQKNLEMIPFYDSNVSSSFFDGGDAPDNVTLGSGQTGSGTPISFWDNSGNGLKPKTVSDIVETTLAQGTVNWTDGGPDEEKYSDTYDGCVLLNGNQENDDNTQTADTLNSSGSIKFGYDWYLPYETDNEVQSDSLTVLYGFDFQQYRHNSTPGQPNVFNPGDNTPGGGT